MGSHLLLCLTTILDSQSNISTLVLITALTRWDHPGLGSLSAFFSFLHTISCTILSNARWRRRLHQSEAVLNQMILPNVMTLLFHSTFIKPRCVHLLRAVIAKTKSKVSAAHCLLCRGDNQLQSAASLRPAHLQDAAKCS